jgi:DNA-binding NtrC family response regulator
MATALIVDDEAVPRNVLAQWLTSAGIDARTAPDAVSALALMKDTPPAVAVVDVRMPGQDGMWLADQIKDRYPETAVVVYTGMADLDVALWCLRDEVFGYLVKPFSREQFEETVGRAIRWHTETTGLAMFN